MINHRQNVTSRRPLMIKKPITTKVIGFFREMRGIYNSILKTTDNSSL